MCLYRASPETNPIFIKDLNPSLELNISLSISDPMMVDTMSRPLNVWAPKPSHPRCYPQEPPGPGIRLPPISSAPTMRNTDPLLSATFDSRRNVSACQDPYSAPYTHSRALPASPPAHAQHVTSSTAPYYTEERSNQDAMAYVKPTSSRPEEVLTPRRNNQHTESQSPSHGMYFEPMVRSPHEQQYESGRRFSGAQPLVPLSLRTGAEAQLEQSQRSWPSPSQAWSPKSEARPAERVRISDLLTDEQESPSKSQPQGRTNPSGTQPQARVQPGHATGTPAIRFRYALTIRQQPVAARSCGFGERDRRVIDPPPIVEVKVDDPSATPDAAREAVRIPFMVMHCTIWDDTGKHDISFMPEEYRQQRRLMGTTVASPFNGCDENGDEGCFFCFPDLSVRTSGTFKLKFILVMADPIGNFVGARHPVRASATSDVFTVYSAKDFPGMQASTPLTKKLKEQGCLISIKKGNERAGRGRNDSDDDDSDDDDGDNGVSTTSRRKKQRK